MTEAQAAELILAVQAVGKLIGAFIAVYIVGLFVRA